MTDIFKHLDYRAYLKEYYEGKKRRFPAFSYQRWSADAGFTSKSFLREVILGDKNLSAASAFKLGKAMGLKEKEQNYFQDLIAFNQAGNIEEKNALMRRVLAHATAASTHKLVLEQLKVHEKWYHHTIRELLPMRDFGGDFAKLARWVQPPIRPEQAEESVRLLLKLGLVTLKDGRYSLASPTVSTGDEVKSALVYEFHRQALMLSMDALVRVPKEERDFSALILGLSRKNYLIIRKEIQAFRKRLLKIAEQEQEPERVFHLNFQLHPTSTEKAGGSP